MEKQKKLQNKIECYSCKHVEWSTLIITPKLKFLHSNKNFLLVIFLSFASYIVTAGQPEILRKVVATFILSSGCWILEVFPLPITGLMIPAVLTLLGVFLPKDAFAPFSHPIIFLMIGGLVLGQAIRKHELDKRIALTLLIYSKGELEMLVLLVMFTAAFISMWMSNTVAVSVILPIILSILNALPNEFINLKEKILLGLSVSTSIGGMAMITGSTPAMIAVAFLEKNANFGFIQWAYYGLPISLLSLLIAFIILNRMYPLVKVNLNIDAVVVQKKNMGNLSGSQKKVIAIFFTTIFLWFMGGQVELVLGLPPSISSAAVVSILTVLAMFGFGLLDLRDLQLIHWELIFLVGGGILLGEAINFSGVAERISSIIASLHGFVPTILILTVLSLISLVLTNFISNSATAAILIPISIDVAHIIGITPIPFVMAVALSATIAFITPIGVPSTSLIYSTGQVSKGNLIKTGIFVAIPTLLVTLIIVWILPIPR
ncbi:SLC13/DASS family transporter [Candidatus Bathyarchaeota archaeon]|nr:SLC13/DASS family transporter [Candidatus Bathyarchaeota archaeon]